MVEQGAALGDGILLGCTLGVCVGNDVLYGVPQILKWVMAIGPLKDTSISTTGCMLTGTFLFGWRPADDTTAA